MLFESMSPQRFILTAIDPEYGHPAFETMFVVEQPHELHALIGTDAEDGPDFEMFYWLEPQDVAAINRHFGLGFDPEGRQTILSKWTTAVGGPPYLAHTGFELVLMIDGRKQFARMQGGFYPPMHFDDEELFDRCVSQGLLHKEEELEKYPEPMQLKDGRVAEGLRTVYYTRKGEEWRIPAWKLIWEASRKFGWNEQFERMEGMLFGYEDWQNDWWLENIGRRGIRFGELSLYLAVSEAELVAIDNAGGRALPLRSQPLELLSAMWKEADDEALRGLLKRDDLVAVVRFGVKASRFLDELAGDRHSSLHTLPGERVKDLNRLIVREIEVVRRRDR
jgi:hypothetical protein